MNRLEGYWRDLASNYTNDAQVKASWETIKSQYSSKKRYYHNLSHLYTMFLQLQDLEAKIDDLNSLKFAIWYHDIIYKPTNNDNEEQSAIFSENVLKTIKYDTIKIEKVKTLIISTKTHELILTENKDNAYLLDLDLSILGSDWNSYKIYLQNIRKEYKIYPDILYKPGRKKVLKHFLERDTLFFTDEFRAKYETQARKNLKQEMAML